MYVAGHAVMFQVKTSLNICSFLRRRKGNQTGNHVRFNSNKKDLTREDINLSKLSCLPDFFHLSSSLHYRLCSLPVDSRFHFLKVQFLSFFWFIHCFLYSRVLKHFFEISTYTMFLLKMTVLISGLTPMFTSAQAPACLLAVVK